MMLTKKTFRTITECLFERRCFTFQSRHTDRQLLIWLFQLRYNRL